MSQTRLSISKLRLESTDRYDGGRRIKRLVEPYRVSLEFPHGIFACTVPAGFETDLASVPRWAWWFSLPDYAEEAAVLHDWLYRCTDVDRFFADAVLRLVMTGRGDSWLMRVAYFWAVRLGGASRRVLPGK